MDCWPTKAASCHALGVWWLAASFIAARQLDALANSHHEAQLQPHANCHHRHCLQATFASRQLAPIMEQVAAIPTPPDK